MVRQLLSLAAFLVLLGSSRAAFAEPPPQVAGAGFISLERGKSREAKISGKMLDKATSVVVHEPRGLSAALVSPASNGEVKLKLTASADAEPGEREIRLVGAGGVSAPVTVFVDQFPDVGEAEPNDDADHCQPVSLPAVLLGRIQSPGDVDRCRFDLKKGQKLIVDVQAARFGSPLDATIALHGPDGAEVAANNDGHDADSFLAFDAPQDGAYSLEIRDLRYRGGDGYDYRIVVGSIPYVESLEPMSGPRGGAVSVRAVGYNLAGGETIPLDLTYASAGRLWLRAKGPAGVSNALPFDISELPPLIEKEPNDDPRKADLIEAPAEITGSIGKPDDEDCFRFKLDRKQMVSIEVVARRIQSPLDGLLTLKKSSGETIEMKDSGDGDPRLARELDAGEYVVSLRDLTYQGGSDYVYRLKLQTDAPGPATGAGQDFAVRLQPDNPRLHRGGNVKLWCDVSRLNGYAGPVTLAVEDLPPGVAFTPTEFTVHASGTFTLSATPDAALGTHPIRIVASGVVDHRLVVREAQVEMPGGRDVRQCYLTVLPAAPFSVMPAADLSVQRRGELEADAKRLAERIEARVKSPEFTQRQAEWEKKTAESADWATLKPELAATSNRVPLTLQPDGSLLVTGPGDNLVPQADLYTVVAKTDLKNITAVRLEALPHASLPMGGPGRSSSGNFVLNRFTVTVAPPNEPGKGQPAAIEKAEATFSQDRYGIAGAIDDNPESGWAVYPKAGEPQSAIFHFKQPIGGEGGALLTIAMDQRYGDLHFLGRFRLSVTTDADPKLTDYVPAPILTVAKTPADKRSPQQKEQIAAYFRDIDPELSALKRHIAGLQSAVGPYAEIAQLQKALNESTPALDAEQRQWERLMTDGARWTPLEFSQMASAGGAELSAERDGSIAVSGASPDQDTYTLLAPLPVSGVTAIRVEALSDPKLPGGGPGRSDNGNFVLTRFEVAAGPKGDTAKVQAISLNSATASFEQVGWSLVGALDDRNETGWAILPNTGRPAHATFQSRQAVGERGDTMLRVVLEQRSANPRHTLGRFRVSVTNALDLKGVDGVPPNVLSALRSANRSGAQRAEVAAYFRSIAPSLEPTRQRLAELLASADAFPPIAMRGAGGSIPLIVRRDDGFNAPVVVTLEGFTPGRENSGPANIQRDLQLTPAAIEEGGLYGAVKFNVNGGTQPNTRLAVLKAEARVGDETIVQYSPAFPITVK